MEIAGTASCDDFSVSDQRASAKRTAFNHTRTES